MMEYRKLSWEMQQWWMCAGDTAREKFLNELNSVRSPSRTPVYESNTKKVDYSYSVDFSNDVYRLGDKVVYIYAKPNGMPFYVGMGGRERPTNVQSRSDDFIGEFIKTNQAKVFIVAVNLDDYSANEIETLCIWLMMAKSWSLCNSAKTNIDYDSFCDLKEKYKEIVSRVNEINDYFLQNVLEEGFTDEKFVTRTDKDERYKSKNVWEIDGKVKSATEWCKEYNDSMANILQRIVKFSLTPKEALTFPKMTYKPSSKSALDWWEEKGYFAGVDTTSRVISIDYCGIKSIDDIA